MEAVLPLPAHWSARCNCLTFELVQLALGILQGPPEFAGVRAVPHLRALSCPFCLSNARRHPGLLCSLHLGQLGHYQLVPFGIENLLQSGGHDVHIRSWRIVFRRVRKHQLDVGSQRVRVLIASSFNLRLHRPEVHRPVHDGVVVRQAHLLRVHGLVERPAPLVRHELLHHAQALLGHHLRHAPRVLRLQLSERRGRQRRGSQPAVLLLLERGLLLALQNHLDHLGAHTLYRTTQHLQLLLQRQSALLAHQAAGERSVAPPLRPGPSPRPHLQRDSAGARAGQCGGRVRGGTPGGGGRERLAGHRDGCGGGGGGRDANRGRAPASALQHLRLATFPRGALGARDSRRARGGGCLGGARRDAPSLQDPRRGQQQRARRQLAREQLRLPGGELHLLVAS
mmetsp:Transcript_6891/g.13103  ORF Transcript_6891/g.13103 Transcript_6891/m.13103 type:complete len:397 (+) Transcript_6891:557-1747(+)